MDESPTFAVHHRVPFVLPELVVPVLILPPAVISKNIRFPLVRDLYTSKRSSDMGIYQPGSFPPIDQPDSKVEVSTQFCCGKSKSTLKYKNCHLQLMDSN